MKSFDTIKVLKTFTLVLHSKTTSGGSNLIVDQSANNIMKFQKGEEYCAMPEDSKHLTIFNNNQDFYLSHTDMNGLIELK